MQQLRDRSLPLRVRLSVLTSAVIPTTCYFGLWFGWPEIFNLTNFGPGFLLFLVLLENINAPHHLDVEVFRGQHKLPVPNQFLVTRTGAYPRWVARFALLNFNLHTEHHLFPSLPWYRLDDATPLLKSALKDQYNETIRNTWVIQNRKRDLSDLLQPPELRTDDDISEFQAS